MRARSCDYCFESENQSRGNIYLISALTNISFLSPKIFFYNVCNSSPARKPSAEQSNRNTLSDIFVIMITRSYFNCNKVENIMF